MKALLLTLPLILLAACSSPGNLKEEAPALRLESGQSPPVYMTCLLPKWQKVRSTATVRELRFGYRLLVPAVSVDNAEALLEPRRRTRAVA